MNRIYPILMSVMLLAGQAFSQKEVMPAAEMKRATHGAA